MKKYLRTFILLAALHFTNLDAAEVKIFKIPNSQVSFHVLEDQRSDGSFAMKLSKVDLGPNHTTTYEDLCNDLATGIYLEHFTLFTKWYVYDPSSPESKKLILRRYKEHIRRVMTIPLADVDEAANFADFCRMRGWNDSPPVQRERRYAVSTEEEACAGASLLGKRRRTFDEEPK